MSSSLQRGAEPGDTLLARAHARWRAATTHPQGRWICLCLEVIEYLALLLAIWACWRAPQSWFAYLGM